MKKLGLIAFAMLAGLMSASVWATPVPSGSPRTYVSTNGRDQGACQNPCLTFQYALSQTSVGGEVIAVESGNFGPVTITNSVTIEAAPGVYAGITPVGSAAGVTVNGVSGANVVLRGLTIYGGSGGDGIDFNGGAALSVENCAINGVGGVSNGIAQTSSGKLSVKDTVISGSGDGVSLKATGAHASLSHVWLENGGNGLILTVGAVASISNSVISGNALPGIIVAFGADLNVESCLVANNGNIISPDIGAGILAEDGGTVLVSNSTVTNNATYGFYEQTSGTFDTRGNNTVAGNGTAPTFGTITPVGGV